MAMLLYCVAEAARSPGSVPRGVRGSPVARREHHGLTVFCSEAPSADAWTAIPVREGALQFYQVLEAVFRSTAIIPFRFPTVVAGTRELREHLDARADLYAGRLERFRTRVQLEALVSYSGEDPRDRGFRGGAEYLRERQQILNATRRSAERLRTAVAPLTSEWRSRTLGKRMQSFALVERQSVAEFKERAEKLSLPEGINVRVSGPWPVTEFLDLSSK